MLRLHPYSVEHSSYSLQGWFNFFIFPREKFLPLNVCGPVEQVWQAIALSNKVGGGYPTYHWLIWQQNNCCISFFSTSGTSTYGLLFSYHIFHSLNSGLKPIDCSSNFPPDKCIQCIGGREISARMCCSCGIYSTAHMNLGTSICFHHRVHNVAQHTTCTIQTRLCSRSLWTEDLWGLLWHVNLPLSGDLTQDLSNTGPQRERQVLYQLNYSNPQILPPGDEPTTLCTALQSSTIATRHKNVCITKTRFDHLWFPGFGYTKNHSPIKAGVLAFVAVL